MEWAEREVLNLHGMSSLCFRETKHKRIRIPFTTTRRIPRYYVRVATPKINSVRFALTNGQRVTSDHHTYRMKPICVNAISTTSINKKCPLVTLGLQLTHNLISSFTCWVITQNNRTLESELNIVMSGVGSIGWACVGTDQQIKQSFVSFKSFYLKFLK